MFVQRMVHQGPPHQVKYLPEFAPEPTLTHTGKKKQREKARMARLSS